MRSSSPLSSALVVASTVAALIACRSATASPTDVVAAAQVPVTPPGTHVGTSPGHAGKGTPLAPEPGHALAAFSEGCFWGSEDTFRHVAGVTATAVGYTGGHTKDPTYEDV
jgi:peptide-methionine (S)-S-oxide reductase